MPTAASLLRRSAPRTPARAPLERALMRRGAGAAEAERHRCVHCHRTPLTGEMVYVYAAAAGSGWCASCAARCAVSRRLDPS